MHGTPPAACFEKMVGQRGRGRFVCFMRMQLERAKTAASPKNATSLLSALHKNNITSGLRLYIDVTSVNKNLLCTMRSYRSFLRCIPEHKTDKDSIPFLGSCRLVFVQRFRSETRTLYSFISISCAIQPPSQCNSIRTLSTSFFCLLLLLLNIQKMPPTTIKASKTIQVRPSPSSIL